MQVDEFIHISNAILGHSRDIFIHYLPAIVLVGGLKFLSDWLHQTLLGKKEFN